MYTSLLQIDYELCSSAVSATTCKLCFLVCSQMKQMYSEQERDFLLWQNYVSS